MKMLKYIINKNIFNFFNDCFDALNNTPTENINSFLIETYKNSFKNPISRDYKLIPDEIQKYNNLNEKFLTL